MNTRSPPLGSAGGLARQNRAERGFDADKPIVLLHDGSFPGFLCAAAEAIAIARGGTPLPRVADGTTNVELFEEPVTVAKDERKAKRIAERIGALAGEDALKEIQEAFCSDIADIGDDLAYAVRKLAGEGRGCLKDWSDPRILRVAKAALRSRSQAHQYAGLIRFGELSDGSLYAPIEPECDILPLVAEHFAGRYPLMHFVIHDVGRGTAMLHNPGDGWIIAQGLEFRPPERDEAAGGAAPGSGVPPGAPLQTGGLPYSDSERRIRECWASYFDAVAIAERKNPRLQASRMPKKRWKHLPEMRFGDGDGKAGMLDLQRNR